VTGQEDAINFLQDMLKKYPDKWWTTREMAQKLHQGISSIGSVMRKVRNNYPDFVKWEMCNTLNANQYLYKARKRR